jgi:hypothetical protein
LTPEAVFFWKKFINGSNDNKVTKPQANIKGITGINFGIPMLGYSKVIVARRPARATNRTFDIKKKKTNEKQVIRYSEQL